MFFAHFLGFQLAIYNQKKIKNETRETKQNKMKILEIKVFYIYGCDIKLIAKPKKEEKKFEGRIYV